MHDVFAVLVLLAHAEAVGGEELALAGVGGVDCRALGAQLALDALGGHAVHVVVHDGAGVVQPQVEEAQVGLVHRDLGPGLQELQLVHLVAVLHLELGVEAADVVAAGAVLLGALHQDDLCARLGGGVGRRDACGAGAHHDDVGVDDLGDKFGGDVLGDDLPGVAGLGGEGGGGVERGLVGRGDGDAAYGCDACRRDGTGYEAPAVHFHG